jgi:hypothetical protein
MPPAGPATNVVEFLSSQNPTKTSKSFRTELEQKFNDTETVVTTASAAVADGTITPEAAAEIIAIYGELLQVIGEDNFFPNFDLDMSVQAILSNLQSGPDQAVVAMRDLLNSALTTQDRQLQERVQIANEQTLRLNTWAETQNLDMRQREYEMDQFDYEWRVAEGNRQALQRQAEGLMSVAQSVDQSQRGYLNTLGQFAQQGTLVPSTPGAVYGGANVYTDLAQQYDVPYAEPRQIGGPIQVPDLAAPFEEARQAILTSAQQIQAQTPSRPAPIPPAPAAPPMGPAG